MKKVLIAVWIVASGVVGNAQNKETRNVGSFKGVKVGEGIDVYLKKGDKESVRLEVSGVETSDVVTEVSGDYLKIDMREGRWKERTVKVYVTYVEVSKLSASSAANLFAENTIKTKSLQVSASSAGTVDITIEVETIDASASTAGEISLKGKATSADFGASSAGEISAYDLSTSTISARASTAGSVKASVEKEIEAHASSGGSIRYQGNPQRSNTNSSSGGSVKKSN
jgi:hypothetical protein